MSRHPTMHDAVQRYLQERRQLGFALKSPGSLTRATRATSSLRQGAIAEWGLVQLIGSEQVTSLHHVSLARER